MRKYIYPGLTDEAKIIIDEVLAEELEPGYCMGRTYREKDLSYDEFDLAHAEDAIIPPALIQAQGYLSAFGLGLKFELRRDYESEQGGKGAWHYEVLKFHYGHPYPTKEETGS